MKGSSVMSTLYDLMDCSPPGSLSMEFSRQEHWSGLPFPSPISNGKFQQCVNYNLNICDTLGKIPNTHYCVSKGTSP